MQEAPNAVTVQKWKERYYSEEKKEFEISETLEEQLKQSCNIYTATEEENKIYNSLNQIAEVFKELSTAEIGLNDYHITGSVHSSF